MLMQNISLSQSAKVVAGVLLLATGTVLLLGTGAPDFLLLFVLGIGASTELAVDLTETML